MKPSYASAAVLSGLAAIVTADALPPDDVPVQCATICGPVVELTAACNTQSSRLLKRRRVDGTDSHQHESRVWIPKLGIEPKVVADVRDDDRLERRRAFSIIVQAPTSFPPDVVPSPTLDLRPTSRPTKVHPVIEDPSATVELSTSVPPATTAAPDTTISVPTAVASTASLADDTTAGELAEQKGWADPEGVEEQCVCLNDSFDVAKVTALCASCISQAGDALNNVDVITTACNFSALEYDTASDAVVDNVRVQATPAVAALGEKAAVDGAADRIGGYVGILMGAVGFAVAILVL